MPPSIPSRSCLESISARATVLAAFLLASMPAQGQITVLRDITLIDGGGDPPRHHVALVLDGPLIRAITPADAATPSGATVVDLSGKTVMPEIINTHGHLGLLRGTKTSASNYTEANVQRELLQYQDYGVGAVNILGTDFDQVYAWRSESQAGTRPGALLFTAGRGFGVPGGLPPIAAGMTAAYRPATPEEARLNVRELAAHHPDFVKIWVDDFYGQFPKMSPAIYTAIIDEAHRHGLRVAAHIYHLEDAQRLVALGVDLLAHSVRDAEIPPALLAEMKRRKTTYVATLSIDEFAFAYEINPPWFDDPLFLNALEPGAHDLLASPQYKQTVRDNKVTAIERGALPIALRNLKLVFDAGIPVALGTDSGASFIRPYGFAEHHELQLLVQAGLTPLQAITVATRNGARLLHAEDRIGTLAPGLRANLIVLALDPAVAIEHTESIVAVWRDGRKVSDGPHPAASLPAER